MRHPSGIAEISEDDPPGSLRRNTCDALVTIGRPRRKSMSERQLVMAPRREQANCLIVGTVATPMVAHLGEEGRERRRKAVPLQTEGTGWDVGWAAVYLASDESRWVTGVMLPIDGGF